MPEGPRPIVQGAAKSKLVVIGQAPGRRVHASGVPWDDASGNRLRDWLGISDAVFYDPAQVALVPMGFCYPGTGKSGDLPPRPECAPAWHPRIFKAMRGLELTILTGRYAVDRYLDEGFAGLTEAVRAFERLLPEKIVLPHPSPRNNIWLKKHPWFEAELLPRLRERVSEILSA